jgi:hypothetical protein
MIKERKKLKMNYKKHYQNYRIIHKKIKDYATENELSPTLLWLYITDTFGKKQKFFSFVYDLMNKKELSYYDLEFYAFFDGYLFNVENLDD